ncbi:hypothetical protein VTJ83DRAFT_3739 [Remersonia thermophila]|uniref:Cerato-platanin n=1 Tax=Remersonia thermophila TaxID=72144 RepID=A0ABR4DEV0_9PEZI
MRLSAIFSVSSLLAAASAAQVSYDVGYDDAGRSLSVVSCSDGHNGLITRFGWQTQGQIPSFPYIGGAQAVGGWNSPSCGTCWAATYNGRTVHILAVDRASNGLNIGLRAMNDLTNGRAVELGRIDADVRQVALSSCGIRA